MLKIGVPGQRMKKSLWVAALAVCIITRTAGTSRGQGICLGDLDNDGQITAADVTAVVPLLFDDQDVDPATQQRADANADGAITAADVAKIVGVLGAPCTVNPTPTGTPPTATPTPTRTPTVTPTPPLRRPTATPTFACPAQTAHLGTPTNGMLTMDDCLESFDNQLRYADLYSIVGTPGTAITVNVTATGVGGFILPLVEVIDPAGEFVSIVGDPPVQFVVTTSQPYLIFVTSDPQSLSQVGSYTMTLTSNACPTPVAIKIGSSHTATLGAPSPTPFPECPDPGQPSTLGVPNPADLYTFTVLAKDVPQNLSLRMVQLNCNTDDIDPFLSVIGPDGFELGNDDDSGQFGGCGNLTDAEMNFLAIQAGTYTIIASGGGGTGSYALQLTAPTCKPTVLNNIPSTGPATCPGQSGPGCQGMLNTTLVGGSPTSACAVPLPIPGNGNAVPDVSSPADLYTFTAAAGDVISVEMDSNDDNDAVLYLFGPASAGNPLVTADDNSGPVARTSNAQLAATLPLAGTYTIVAGNNNQLLPGDDPVNYTLFVQKCPARGLNASTLSVADNFQVFDCFGFGGVPFRSYAFNGTAGQFATVTMSSKSVDAFVRLFAPDGSHVDNDNDLFNPAGTDARVNRILPQTGKYFVEVSSSLGQGAVKVTGGTPASFAAAVQTCATTVATPQINGAFQTSDCELTQNGRRYDVYTLPAGTPPRVASVLPPSNGCAVALLPEGLQTPETGCSTSLLEFPVVDAGTYGFMIAESDANTPEPYTAQLSSCPLSTIGYGAIQPGTLSAADCADAAGNRADWFLFQAPADLVQFNIAFSGALTSAFPSASVLTDEVSTIPLTSLFAEDPDAMYPLGNTLASLLKITGTTPGATGSYTLSIDPATLRQ
ncbi:MAG: pre-peptidase C-terminal domain-containing protein [Candidatus Binatia bacterium]